MRRVILFLTLTIVIIGSGYQAWRVYSFNQKSATYKALTASSKPIEGKFALVDHNGNSVTQDDFRGKHTLVFFGYTYCPDVCPTVLQDVSLILDSLGDQADKIVPLFITVDPARDTVEVMKDYISNFHPSIVGLSGDQKSMIAASQSFRAYFAKVVPDPNDPEDYHMSHSARLFMMGPDTKPVTSFQYGETVDNMTKKIREIL
jgi:protein SCO1/2